MTSVLNQMFSDFILIHRPDLYKKSVDIYEKITIYDKLAADLYDCRIYQTSLSNIETRKEKTMKAGKLLFDLGHEIVELNDEFKKQYRTSFLDNDDYSTLEGCLIIITDYCNIGDIFKN